MAVEENADESGESTSSPATSLESLFGHSSSEPEEPNSSSADEKESKADDEDKANQRTPESESSPSDKKDDKQAKTEKPAPEKAKADKEADSKEDKSSQEAKDAKAAQEKWENEENPYFKRYRDTASNWQKEHQEKLQYQNAVAQLQNQVQTLQKIADGTYDPEKDGPQQVSHEDVASRGLHVGKVLASRGAAIAQYGADEVNTRLTEFNQVFAGNELINNLVLGAEAPVYEAFRILDRYKFETKYGSTPDDWHKNIRAEAEKELREQIRKEVTEELMGRVDKQKSTPRGLSSSRGSNGLGTSQNSKGKGPIALGELFAK